MYSSSFVTSALILLFGAQIAVQNCSCRPVEHATSPISLRASAPQDAMKQFLGLRPAEKLPEDTDTTALSDLPDLPDMPDLPALPDVKNDKFAGFTFAYCKGSNECRGKRICSNHNVTGMCNGGNDCFCTGFGTAVCTACRACRRFPYEVCVNKIGDDSGKGNCASLFYGYDGVHQKLGC